MAKPLKAKPISSVRELRRAIEGQKMGFPNPPCHRCDEAVEWEEFPDDTWIREFRITRLCKSCMDELGIKPQE